MSHPTLLALTGELPALLRDQDSALLDALRHLPAGVAVVVGAEGRPLQLDPVAVATALSVHVPGLPVIVASDGIRDAPYNAARRFLSLDHLLGGLSGVVFRSGEGDAAQTAERIDVIRALWNSWPAETLLADRESGVYATTENIRRIEHEGAHYRVAGALNSPTSAQGEPVSIWHIDSADDLVAAHGLVDVVVIEDPTLIAQWADSDPVDRPALAAESGVEGASIVYREVHRLDEVAALAAASDRPALSLRDVLGVAPRRYDLSAKPLAFGAAR